MRVRVDSLVQGYGKKTIIDDVSFDVPEGEVVAILGPNGSGKSTIIRTMAGLMDPKSGKVTVGERDLKDISLEERARLMSYVPQSYNYMPFSSVMDTVLSGRAPYMGWEPSDKDLEIVEESLKFMDIMDLAMENINELSGGQRQRVFIARAICQTPEIFYFDEPTSALDLKYQIDTMKRMYKYVHENNKSVLIAVHDINLALRYCDRAVMLKNGKIYSEGAPSDTITERSILDVYSVKAAFTENEYGTFIMPYDSV